MSLKAKSLFIIHIFVGAAILFLCGCKKDNSKPAPWLSQKFVGNYSGAEVCSVTGTQSNSITISATDSNKVSIVNLYGSGKTFTGVVSNDSCIITPQVYATGSGNAQLQGSFVLISDTINLSTITATFGQQDICNAVLVKH